MEVKLTDEERTRVHDLPRADRDVIAQDAGQAEEGQGRQAEPAFVDRVLNKAVDHMRKTVEKQPVATPKGDA